MCLRLQANFDLFMCVLFKHKEQCLNVSLLSCGTRLNCLGGSGVPPALLYLPLSLSLADGDTIPYFFFSLAERESQCKPPPPPLLPDRAACRRAAPTGTVQDAGRHAATTAPRFL